MFLEISLRWCGSRRETGNPCRFLQIEHYPLFRWGGGPLRGSAGRLGLDRWGGSPTSNSSSFSSSSSLSSPPSSSPSSISSPSSLSSPGSESSGEAHPASRTRVLLSISLDFRSYVPALFRADTSRSFLPTRLSICELWNDRGSRTSNTTMHCHPSGAAVFLCPFPTPAPCLNDRSIVAGSVSGSNENHCVFLPITHCMERTPAVYFCPSETLTPVARFPRDPWYVSSRLLHLPRTRSPSSRPRGNSRRGGGHRHRCSARIRPIWGKQSRRATL